MASYFDKLIERRDREDDSVLAWELEESLNNKRDKGQKLSSVEELAWHICTVANCDGIEGVLESTPESVQVAADFARQQGMSKLAELLTDASRGVSLPADAVSLHAVIDGKKIPIPMEPDKWGAVDLAMSLMEERLETALMDYLAEHGEDVDIPPTKAAIEKEGLAARVSKISDGKRPLDLFRELLGHANPRIRAQLSEYDRTDKPADWLEVPVAHRTGGPANAKALEKMEQKYGSDAAGLLDIFEAYDGAELFVADGNPGIVFLPLEYWADGMADVMGWAREVTWNGEEEEIPDYLESSIAFAKIPGDSEYWLFVTKGKHAGKVMLSDTDAIDDDPRFLSLEEFMATLILDVRKIVGCGGYISYGHGKHEGMYYPEKYLYQSV